MKKLWMLLLGIFVCGICHAVETDPTTFLTYTIENTSLNSTAKLTLIPTTSIYPGSDRIIGWEITRLYSYTTANPEMWVEIYDSSNACPQITDEVLDESESGDNGSLSKFFSSPRNIENGILVRQGSLTVVTIYFER